MPNVINWVPEPIKIEDRCPCPLCGGDVHKISEEQWEVDERQSLDQANEVADVFINSACRKCGRLYRWHQVANAIRITKNSDITMWICDLCGCEAWMARDRRAQVCFRCDREAGIFDTDHGPGFSQQPRPKPPPMTRWFDRAGRAMGLAAGWLFRFTSKRRFSCEDGN